MEKITKEQLKGFRNAMCGKPKDYKFWQDYYDKGDMDGVYKCWKNSAKEEKVSKFWRVIIEMIDFKIKKTKEQILKDIERIFDIKEAGEDLILPLAGQEHRNKLSKAIISKLKKTIK